MTEITVPVPEVSHAEVMHYKNAAILIEVYYDRDAESPENEFYTIISFNTKHRGYMLPSKAMEEYKGDHMVVPLSYFEHGRCRWGVAGAISGMPDFQWDGVYFAGIWVPSADAKAQIRVNALRRMMPDVQIGWCQLPTVSGSGITPGSVKIVLPNGDERRGYSTYEAALRSAARILGVKVGAQERRPYEESEARTMAVQCCEIYTAWANGDVYGYDIKVFRDFSGSDNPDDYEGRTPLEEDSCFGFYGLTHLEEQIKEAVKHILETTAPQLEMSNEEFDQTLKEILNEHTGEQLLSIPGAYEVFSEHFYNEVLKRWGQNDA